MKTQQTKRKFYNKWFYKVSLFIDSASRLRLGEYDKVANDRRQNASLRSFSKLLSSLDRKDFAIRIEGRYIDFYTNNNDRFESILKDFGPIVRLCSRPDENIQSILEIPRSIVAKKLPHDRYRYKVFLHPHKIKDRADKKRYIDWLKTQEPRVNITDTVKTWFEHTDWNWDRRYMYVEDDHTMLILKMKNSEVMGSVYTYVIHDK
jgi:hypothetical protein